MAEQKVDVIYAKSPLWRALFATGAVISTITGPTGQQVTIRITNDWSEVEKETFLADVNKSAGTYAIKSDSEITMGPLIKLEEVAVIMPPDAVGNIVAALLSQFQHYSETTKEKVRGAIAKIPQK